MRIKIKAFLWLIRLGWWRLFSKKRADAMTERLALELREIEADLSGAKQEYSAASTLQEVNDLNERYGIK